MLPLKFGNINYIMHSLQKKIIILVRVYKGGYYNL